MLKIMGKNIFTILRREFCLSKPMLYLPHCFVHVSSEGSEQTVCLSRLVLAYVADRPMSTKILMRCIFFGETIHLVLEYKVLHRFR